MPITLSEMAKTMQHILEYQYEHGNLNDHLVVKEILRLRAEVKELKAKIKELNT